MKKKEMMSPFKKICKNNRGLAIKIFTSEKISSTSFYKIMSTGRGSDDFKHRIFCYLIENNYIKLGQYTLPEFFETE